MEEDVVIDRVGTTKFGKFMDRSFEDLIRESAEALNRVAGSIEHRI